jgi:Protein of unknown function (DUF2510)
MASAGPTPPPGWYTDPQSPAQLRFWDGAGWTERTSPAGPPAPPPGGQGWGQGAGQRAGQGIGQPPRGGLIASLFPQRPGETDDDALVRQFSSYERTSGYIWIAIGIIQVICLITIIAGVWNIYVGINRGRLAAQIERRDPYVPATFEPLTSYIISAALNLVLGGVLGLAMVVADVYVRDQVLKNRQLFGASAASYGYSPPGYAPGPSGYGQGTPGYPPGVPAPPSVPPADGPAFPGRP